MTREPMDILNELLVLNAESGDKNALGELVEMWTPRLHARARWLTHDEEGTRDVVQEAWVGIAKGLGRLKDPARFGAWAMRIVHHKSADWIKVQSSHRRLESNLWDEATRSEPEKKEDHGHAIRTAIGHLDPKLREVVYLFFLDNCTLEQIACVLEIPVGTAKTRLARARIQLKHLLERSTQ